MDADTKRGADCDYPASWCLFPGCEKCRATHPGLGRLAAQGLHVVTAAEKSVLEASSNVNDGLCRLLKRSPLAQRFPELGVLADAIIARREAEKEKTK